MIIGNRWPGGDELRRRAELLEADVRYRVSLLFPLPGINVLVLLSAEATTRELHGRLAGSCA